MEQLRDYLNSPYVWGLCGLSYDEYDNLQGYVYSCREDDPYMSTSEDYVSSEYLIEKMGVSEDTPVIDGHIRL